MGGDAHLLYIILSFVVTTQLKAVSILHKQELFFFTSDYLDSTEVFKYLFNGEKMMLLFMVIFFFVLVIQLRMEYISV